MCEVRYYLKLYLMYKLYPPSRYRRDLYDKVKNYSQVYNAVVDGCL